MHFDHPGRAAAVSLFLLAFIPLPRTLRAGVVFEETYQLAMGWNFIRVPFEPQVQDPQLALATIEWDSIWAWVPASDPQGNGQWIAAYRDAPPFLNTLPAILGPGSYGILMKAAGSLT